MARNNCNGLYKLNLAFINVSAELTRRIDSEKWQSYKTFFSKLQSKWASGKNGISPSHLNEVNSLEEWLAFLLVSKKWVVFLEIVPMSRKRSLLIGENHLVNRNSSLSNLDKSKAELRKRFLANGYTQKIVGRLFDSIVPATQRSEETKHLTFIKLPFYG